jgi:hypothetical protein
MGSVPVMTSYNSRGNRIGVFYGVRSPAIIDGSNSCCRVSYVDSSNYGVSQLQLRVTSEYSGRAAVFREELQSCRRTDPAILEDRQRVKIQCEDSASEL